jgi:hypothetical protein
MTLMAIQKPIDLAAQFQTTAYSLRKLRLSVLMLASAESNSKQCIGCLP